MSKTEAEFIRDLYSSKGRSGLVAVVAHQVFRVLRRHSYHIKETDIPGTVRDTVQPLEGLGPLNPVYTLELQVLREHRKYPVAVRADIEYLSSNKEGDIQEKNAQQLLFFNLSGNAVVDYEERIIVEMRKTEEGHRVVSASTVIKTLEDLRLLEFFYRIPEAVRIASDGSSMGKIRNSWYQAMREVAHRSTQETPAASSVPLPVAQP